MNRGIPMNRRRRTVDVELVILLVALILLSIAAQWVNRNLNLSETELPAGELRVTPASLSDSLINGDGGAPRIQPGLLSVKEAD
ncbi:MAG: hypothetical protein KatS3mg049_0708 [Caldilinea sp.]|jgi:hypothetical protein|nr:MAG: hypothetical protein KatS3mg049_0708 [Caldilinea sp.]